MSDNEGVRRRGPLGVRERPGDAENVLYARRSEGQDAESIIGTAGQTTEISHGLGPLAREMNREKEKRERVKTKKQEARGNNG